MTRSKRMCEIAGAAGYLIALAYFWPPSFEGALALSVWYWLVRLVLWGSI